MSDDFEKRLAVLELEHAALIQALFWVAGFEGNDQLRALGEAWEQEKQKAQQTDDPVVS